jgi:hypothetical protein
VAERDGSRLQTQILFPSFRDEFQGIHEFGLFWSVRASRKRAR